VSSSPTLNRTNGVPKQSGANCLRCASAICTAGAWCCPQGASPILIPPLCRPSLLLHSVKLNPLVPFVVEVHHTLLLLLMSTQPG
jgi:hypothetical protein